MPEGVLAEKLMELYQLAVLVVVAVELLTLMVMQTQVVVDQAELQQAVPALSF